jgi:hypothetical protein
VSRVVACGDVGRWLVLSGLVSAFSLAAPVGGSTQPSDGGVRPPVMPVHRPGDCLGTVTCLCGEQRLFGEELCIDAW